MVHTNLLQEILDILYSDSIIFDCDEFGVEKMLRAHYPDCPSYPIEVFCGASKICVVACNEPWVLKWTKVNDDCWDECSCEAYIYKKACLIGLQDFFPETEVIKNNFNVDLILQHKVDYNCSNIPINDSRILSKRTKTCRREIVMKARSSMNYDPDGPYMRNPDIKWVEAALSRYGRQKMKLLAKFIKENSINDLHSDNLGYINLRPVILDFSGYHREDYYY